MTNVGVLVNELFPASQQLTVMFLSYSLGCGLGNLLAAFLNYVLPSWRGTLAVANLAGLLCLFMLHFFREPAQFFLDNHRYREAFQHIDLAIKANDPSAPGLSQEEQEQLKTHYNRTRSPEAAFGYLKILEREYLRNNLLMFLQWSINFLGLYSFTIILPQALAKEGYYSEKG